MTTNPMLVTLLIILALLFGGGLVAAIFIHKSRVKSPLVAPPGLLAEVELFKSEAEPINSSVELIEGFKGDYFSTLNEAGFPAVMEVNETVQYVIQLCDSMLTEKYFSECSDLIDLVNSRKNKSEVSQSVQSLLSDHQLFLLAGWQQRARQGLALVEDKLRETSEEFKKIGRVKRTRRKSTSTILGEMRAKIFGVVVVNPDKEDKK